MTEPMVDLMVPTLRELSARRSEKWALYEPDVLSLTIAEMDFPIFAPIRDALVATIGRGDLGYAVPTPGTLSAALTRFAQRRLNWRIDPEQVTVIPDVMLGLVELWRMLAPGEAVGFATPDYPPFFRELSTAGLRRVEVPLRSDGAVDLDALDAALSDGLRAFVLANPHNPTGRVLPRPELEAIAERCAAHETIEAPAPGDRPVKFEHISCKIANHRAEERFLTKGLGLRFSDRMGFLASWWHCNEDHHGIALTRAPRAELSHYAYQWPDFAALGRVADRLKVHRGRKCIWGPSLPRSGQQPLPVLPRRRRCDDRVLLGARSDAGRPLPTA